MFSRAMIALVVFMSFLYMGYSWWRVGPWDSVSTGNRSWLMMRAEETTGLSFPMLYDVYYNGMTIRVGDQQTSSRWIDVVIYSKGGVTEAWASAETMGEPQLGMAPEQGNILGVAATVQHSRDNGRRWTLSIPEEMKLPFTVYVVNNKGVIYFVTIDPAEVVDP